MIPRVAKKSGGVQPQTPLRPYGVMPNTTGKRPGSGFWPSADGNATVAASSTPSSIGISTSFETLLYDGSGSFGGGADGFACAVATGAMRAATMTAANVFRMAPPQPRGKFRSRVDFATHRARVAARTRRGMRAALALALTLAFAAPASATPPLANRCVKLGSLGRFYLKPTRLGGYFMLLGTDGKLRGADTPGPAAEWSIKRVRGARFRVRNTQSGRLLGAHLRVGSARGCRSFPEA